MDVIKKIIKIIIIFLLILTAIKCNTTSTDEGLYCINCISEQPDSGRISIKISNNVNDTKTRVIIYNGKFNYNNKDTICDTLIDNSFTFKVLVDKFYSCEAVYYSDGKVIKAIDGGWFESRKLSGCQNECWQLIGGEYDLRLKNY